MSLATVLAIYKGVRPRPRYERNQDVFFQEGEEITIPGSGYQLGQAWFFMDQEAFDSLLVRGYFMENLSRRLIN